MFCASSYSTSRELVAGSIICTISLYQSGSKSWPSSTSTAPYWARGIWPLSTPAITAGGNASMKALPLPGGRSEEHTSELQSLMRISYAVFCLKKKTNHQPLNNLIDLMNNALRLCKSTYNNTCNNN